MSSRPFEAFVVYLAQHPDEADRVASDPNGFGAELMKRHGLSAAQQKIILSRDVLHYRDEMFREPKEPGDPEEPPGHSIIFCAR